MTDYKMLDVVSEKLNAIVAKYNASGLGLKEFTIYGKSVDGKYYGSVNRLVMDTRDKCDDNTLNEFAVECESILNVMDFDIVSSIGKSGTDGGLTFTFIDSKLVWKPSEVLIKNST